jgi:hypothetical protein
VDVIDVGKTLVIPVTFEALKELTLERNLMDVSNVDKGFLCPSTFKRHKGTYIREKSYGCHQFPGTLTNGNSLYREALLM